jgi:plasmid stability protein
VANLTIRNLDDKIVENLKARAKANHRSLEAEVRLLLEQYGRQPSREELIRLAKEIAALSPPQPQINSIVPMREDRSR